MSRNAITPKGREVALYKLLVHNAAELVTICSNGELFRAGEAMSEVVRRSTASHGLKAVRMIGCLLSNTHSAPNAIWVVTLLSSVSSTNWTPSE